MTQTEDAALEIAVQAVIYGLPIVMMELTKQNASNIESPRGMAAPINQFAHVPQFPPASFKQVVRANVDTLYSSAFLDLSAEPLVLTVPESHGRYYLFPMFDGWTDVFATPGTRTTGNGAGTFVIAGPRWHGTPPAGAKVLASSTNLVWILGRIQTNGPADYAAVHALQAGFSLVPLSAYGAPYTPPKGTFDPSFDSKTPPVKKLEALSSQQYFTLLAALLATNPPPPRDAAMIERLASIGIVAGQPWTPDRRLDNAMAAALGRLAEATKSIGSVVNGWHVPASILGNFGTSYDMRAVIALIAFGANLPQDAVYPTAFVDIDGTQLDAGKRYVLHFDRAPPVNAFWSVTLYDRESFFVENAIGRQAISSWMPLAQNPDGSIDIYIQRDALETPNWLPAPPSGPFNLTLRMYWPKPELFDGSWQIPGVTRVG